MGETFNQLLELIKNNTTFAIIVAATFAVIMFLSLTIIFYKIRVKAWKGLIPIYNVMTLIDVLGIPVWMILVMLIPFVNLIGIPIMLIIIGWKLGNYCNKGLFMKIGLSILPPIFIPILSFCYIDIDGTGYEFVPVKTDEDFALDVVEVSNVDTNLMAMSLNDVGIMEKIAPPTLVRETEKPKTETVAKKSMKDINVGAASNEIEDLKKVLPTADDLTFDYNSLYSSQENETVEEKEETPKEELQKSDFPTAESKEENSTINYDELYTSELKEEKEEPLEIVEEKLESEETQEEEPEIEEPTIVIHDVVLEAAEPVTESLGPIPINRRYDMQQKKEAIVGKVAKLETSSSTVSTLDNLPKENSEKNVSESSTEVETQMQEEMVIEEDINAQEINPLAPPVIAPVLSSEEEKSNLSEVTPINPSVPASFSIPSTAAKEEVVEENLPMQAANPFGSGELPTLADIPDLQLPEISEAPTTAIPEVNVSDFAMQGLREQSVIGGGTRVDQIVSMNIAEPSQLPVGVLTKAPGKKEEPVVPPTPIPEPVAPVPMAPAVNPNMTRAEAMGIRNTFFSDVVPSTPVMNPQMSNIPVNGFQGGMPNSMISQPMPVQGNLSQNSQVPMMNNGMRMPMGMPPQGMMQQPADPTAIFQVNTSGAPLLRPVENNSVPAEKNCPVCGVKLKQDCPICIMCGFKF